MTIKPLVITIAPMIIDFGSPILDTKNPIAVAPTTEVMGIGNIM